MNILLADLEIPFRSFVSDVVPVNINISAATTVTFYDVQTARKRMSNMRGRPVLLTIKWETPLPQATVDSLSKVSGGNWTEPVQKYFEKQVIKDVITAKYK